MTRKCDVMYKLLPGPWQMRDLEREKGTNFPLFTEDPVIITVGVRSSTWPNEEDCLGFEWNSRAGGEWVGAKINKRARVLLVLSYGMILVEGAICGLGG